MKVFDSHIHLDEIGEANAPEAETYRALVPGIEPEKTCQNMGDMARRGHVISIGLHPWYVGEEEPEGERWDRVKEIASGPEVLAIGETGLDKYKHKGAVMRGRARRWFEAHARLADSLKKPLVVHCVKAHGECLEILGRIQPEAGGIIHAFSGSLEVMKDYERLGFGVGIGVAVTRERSKRAREAASKVPACQLFLETDAPFMSINGRASGNARDILQVLEVVAELRGVEKEEIAEQTWQNARVMFGFQD